MKKQKAISRFMAAVLAVCMVFALMAVPAAALADSETDTSTSSGADAGTANEASSHPEYAEYVRADEDGKEVKESIPAIENAPENGILVEAVNGGFANVSMEGDISANGSGITVTADEKGKTSESTASIFADDVETKTKEGVHAEATESGTIASAITGDVTVTGEDVYGVWVQAGEFENIKDAKQEGDALKGTSDDGAAQDEAGEDSAQAASGVEALQAEDGGDAPQVSSDGEPALAEAGEDSGDGASDLSASGFVKAGESDIASVVIYPGEGEEGWTIESQLNLPEAALLGTEEELKALSEEETDEDWFAQAAVGDVSAYAGVRVEAIGGGSATLVAESVTVTGGNIYGDKDSKEDAELPNFIASYMLGEASGQPGDIVSPANEMNLYTYGGITLGYAGAIKAGEEGIDLDNLGGYIWTEADSIESGLNGIDANTANEDGANFVFVTEDVHSSDENAIHVVNYDGQAFIAVGGDAASSAKDDDTAGLSYFGTGDKSGAIVVVAGTLSGANGVLLSDFEENDPSKLDLTVWKIEKTSEKGKLIAGDDEDGTFAKSISYIVMVEQAGEGGTLQATKADGSKLDRKLDNEGEGGFEVAVEGQKVLLKVEDLQPGYRVAGAYNGTDRVELSVDEDGNYYLIVPQGGGVLLSAILEKLRKEGNSINLYAPSAVIRLDAAGGTINGKSEYEVRKAIGKTFVFAEEPVWEGHTFLYWENPEGVQYHTGDKFIITGNQAFTAVWG